MLEELINKGEAFRGETVRTWKKLGIPFANLFEGKSEARTRRGDLKFLILEVLNEKPRHGYDVILELEAKNQGLYRPSAGSVYPTLQMLEEGGYLSSEHVEDKNVYTVTESGRTLLEQKERREPQPEVNNGWEQMLEVQDSAVKLAAALMQAVRDQDPRTVAQAKHIIDQARRDIYLLLADDQN